MTKPTTELIAGRVHCIYSGRSIANFLTQGEAESFNDAFRASAVVGALEPGQFASCLSAAAVRDGDVMEAASHGDLVGASHSDFDVSVCKNTAG